MTDLIYKEEVFAIVGAAMEVHTVLGPGFLEAVYQEALEIEFAMRQIPFLPQHELHIDYKGRYLKKTYFADYVAYNDIIIEIKAMERLTSREIAQLLNYLNATGAKVGVLINFGSVGRLEWKRMVRTSI
jgi:GxxExxY protein